MINYPLIIPPALGEAEAVLTKFDAVAENISPFTGQAEEQQWVQHQLWELELDFPEQPWATAAAMDAFLGALHGKYGTFKWGPPWGTAPAGTAQGSPVAVGTDVTGSQVLTSSAWAPNQPAALQPGDYFEIDAPVAGTTTQALIGLSRTSGIVTAVYQLFLPGGYLPTVGSFIFVQVFSGDPSLGGGPFKVASVNVRFLGSRVFVTWPQAGPDSNAAFTGNMLTSVPVVRLYQYVGQSPLASDGGGNAVIDIFPCLREAPPAGMPLLLNNPQGTFRLADNRRKAPAKSKKTFTFQMKCREAL